MILNIYKGQVTNQRSSAWLRQLFAFRKADMIFKKQYDISFIKNFPLFRKKVKTSSTFYDYLWSTHLYFETSIDLDGEKKENSSLQIEIP